MRNFKYIALGSILILIAGFLYWRMRAPSFKGQDLHISVTVPDEFEILMVGDMGTGDDNQESIAGAMNSYCETHKVIAMVFLGDNFYPKGVASVNDPQWQEKFLGPYGQDCLKKLPFYALLGNHDYKGNTQAQVDFHSQDPTWIMPHRFYDVQFGNKISLTMTDSNIFDVCGLDHYCTIDFMLASLRQVTARFKMVLAHHPIASSSGKYAQTFQGWLTEKLLCGHADAYISGHSHHLEHLTAESCPMDLFVVGGGGAELYDVKKWRPETHFAESSFGFLRLKVSPDGLNFAFYNGDLKELYSYDKRLPN